jgi:hypothetical protein
LCMAWQPSAYDLSWASRDLSYPLYRYGGEDKECRNNEGDRGTVK